MNARAVRTLERLGRRYNIEPVPSLREVESALWRAGEFADRGFGGYSPWRQGLLLQSNIEGWTSTHLGWSFPCAEAVGLIRRVMHWPSGRIIDVGAGYGLWTKVLKREFGPDNVIGLDPEFRTEDLLAATFEDWCATTGGPADTDLLLASWLPCTGQPGSSLGPQLLDSIRSDQTLLYVGSGPNGPAATREFYDRLAVEFEEFASEPLPRVYPSVFPRDFLRVFRRKV